MADVIEEIIAQLKVIAEQAEEAYNNHELNRYGQLMRKGRGLAKRIRRAGTGEVHIVTAKTNRGNTYDICYANCTVAQVKALLKFDLKERLLSYNIKTIICRTPRQAQKSLDK